MAIFFNFRKITNPSRNRGVSLLVVLIILIITSLLGVASIQISRMATQAARNERDTQIAFQAAEAALLDAELDILGIPGSKRGHLFDNENINEADFQENCGTADNRKGLCAPSTTGNPVWLEINNLNHGIINYAEFGEFTSRNYPHSVLGIAPALKPRYAIEYLPDYSNPTTNQTNKKYIFRITAIGYGPSEKIQVVLQSVYRK